jgi:DNA-binding winged helix-turn-helix (wHTH) protein
MSVFMTISIIQTSRPKTGRLGNLSNSSGKRYVCLGTVQIDLQSGVVSRDGSRIRVSGKAYTALLALLERPGEVVTRESFYQCLWPSKSEAQRDWNLNMTISALRRALGDSSLRPFYIETIPQKGYVLIAHPEISDHPIKLFVSNAMQAKSSPLNPRVSPASQGAFHSGLWTILCMIGLILLGVLFGSGMMAVWIAYNRNGPTLR